MVQEGWVGVDLDGTLATYDFWRGIDHIGEPVPVMVERVKRWLAQGEDIRIFSARVSSSEKNRQRAEEVIKAWCVIHLGKALPVTAEKDFKCIAIWDDRCVAIEKNTGRVQGPEL